MLLPLVLRQECNVFLEGGTTMLKGHHPSYSATTCTGSTMGELQQITKMEILRSYVLYNDKATCEKIKYQTTVFFFHRKTILCEKFANIFFYCLFFRISIPSVFLQNTTTIEIFVINRKLIFI
jgi:hypothetical protein